MEFCLRAILVTVIGLIMCFLEPAISQREDFPDDSGKLPEGVTIDAKAVKGKYGDIHTTWDIQPANWVKRVQPQIETVVEGKYIYRSRRDHHLAKNSQCFSRQFPNSTYNCTVAIDFVNSNQSYIYDLGTLPPVNIGKSLNFLDANVYFKCDYIIQVFIVTFSSTKCEIGKDELWHFRIHI